jgi:putative oxidoreductase
VGEPDRALPGAEVALYPLQEGVMTRYSPQIFAILRVISGLMFAMHGTQKLFHWPPSNHPGAGKDMATLMMIGGIIELAGGLLIAIGLLTRIAAFICSGEMAVAFFMVHAKHGSLLPIVNQGELAVLYCFVFLYFAAAGAGVWSADATMRRNGAGVRR